MNTTLKEITKTLKGAEVILRRNLVGGDREGSAFQGIDFDPHDPEHARQLANTIAALVSIQHVVEQACDDLGFKLRTLDNEERERSDSPGVVYFVQQGVTLDAAKRISSALSGTLADLASSLRAYHAETKETQ